jgi:hypothetical protein
MLSWLGPGSRNRGVFEQAYVNAGGDLDALTVWYEEAGEAYKTQPEKLQRMHDAIQQAIRDLGLKEPSRQELVRYVQAQHENDVFKQLVSDQLGDGFFDWTDADGQAHQGLYSFYNSLDYDGKKEFRRNYPDEYALIKDYYAMKETFGEEHPTWNDYYGFDTTPTVSLPENQETGSVLTPPSPTRPMGGGGGGKNRRPVQPSLPVPGGSYSYSGEDRSPSFYIQSRIGGPSLSSDLLRVVGDTMAWEITQAFSTGRPISQAGMSFLRSVAVRYPKFKREIDNILARM